MPPRLGADSRGPSLLRAIELMKKANRRRTSSRWLARLADDALNCPMRRRLLLLLATATPRGRRYMRHREHVRNPRVPQGSARSSRVPARPISRVFGSSVRRRERRSLLERGRHPAVFHPHAMGSCDQQFIMDADGGNVRRVSTGTARPPAAISRSRSSDLLLIDSSRDSACPPRPDFSRGYVWRPSPSTSTPPMRAARISAASRTGTHIPLKALFRRMARASSSHPPRTVTSRSTPCAPTALTSAG